MMCLYLLLLNLASPRLAFARTCSAILLLAVAVALHSHAGLIVSDRCSAILALALAVARLSLSGLKRPSLILFNTWTLNCPSGTRNGGRMPTAQSKCALICFGMRQSASFHLCRKNTHSSRRRPVCNPCATAKYVKAMVAWAVQKLRMQERRTRKRIENARLRKLVKRLQWRKEACNYWLLTCSIGADCASDTQRPKRRSCQTTMQ